MTENLENNVLRYLVIDFSCILKMGKLKNRCS